MKMQASGPECLAQLEIERGIKHNSTPQDPSPSLGRNVENKNHDIKPNGRDIR